MIVIYLAILVPISVWLFVSPFVWVYWFFYPDALDRFSGKHERICAAVGIGAFLGLWFIIGFGIERILWFIPREWVYHNEEGELRGVRTAIVGFLGLGAAVFIVCLFDKVRKLRREVIKLRNQVAKATWKEKFRHMEGNELEEKAAEFQRKIEKLHKWSDNAGLTAEQDAEWNLVEELLYELQEEKIRKTDKNNKQTGNR